MLREDQKRRAQGSRGKYAEGKVREYLQKLSDKVAGFDWARIYDARSAGGRFPSRPGDFEFYRAGQFGLLEVKEVAHDFRLPAKNFKQGQIAKLRKRELAGGIIVVLVYHSTSGKWRYVPLDCFVEEITQPSWDLTALPRRTSLRDVLQNIHILQMPGE